jgi:thiamine biosynthesis lipoprotein
MNALAATAARADPAARPHASAEERAGFVRRARPLLGTIVEIGAARAAGFDAAIAAAIDAAFARVAAIQARLSRFEATSDIARFNAAPAGARFAVTLDTQRVLALAGDLSTASDGAFDVTLASGADHWRCEGGVLRKLSDAVRIDLGGIGKGYAVDAAIDSLRAAGVAAGWVNAGGDLRAFGAIEVPIDVRDEDRGGVRRFAHLGEGAFATSRLVARGGRTRHVSVAAPICVWADALTKVVVVTGDVDHPLLARCAARAWLHAPRRSGACA